MITNKMITYYKKGLDPETKLITWTKHVFGPVWVFGGKGSGINKGYENANNVDVRIPMEQVQDETIFALEDIVAIGEQGNITKQSDLDGKEFYNVTSITVNGYGNNPHVHLGGK